MARVYQIKNPSNNVLNDIPLEDNAVLISGYFYDVGVVRNGSLFSISESNNLVALYDESGEYYQNDTDFPIGSPIYVYIGSQVLSDEEVNQFKVYKSYYNVPLSVNGVDVEDQSFTDKFDFYDAVWLKVTLNSDYTRWSPVDIVGTTGLISGNYYIRLGAYGGDPNAGSADDLDKFNLEIENKLFYYYVQNSVPYLIPFEIWRMKSAYLPLAGGTMTGTINMGNKKITDVASPTASNDAVNKDYVDNAVSGNLGQGYGTVTSVTSATPPTYNVTLSGYELQKGYVTVKFDSTGAAAGSKLNINSKGGKPIFYNSSAITANIIKAGDIALFYYDGTNYNLVCYMERYELVTSVSSSSTHKQYPSAKCLYDLVGDIETLLAAI